MCIKFFFHYKNFFLKLKPFLEKLFFLKLHLTAWNLQQQKLSGCRAAHYMKGQIHHQEMCIHKILQWKRTAISWNGCIECKFGSSSSVDEEWNMVPKGWGTSQFHTAASSICKQKLDQCWDTVKQHGKRGFRHTPWNGDIPSLMLCPQGKHDNRSLVAIFKKDSKPVTKATKNTAMPPSIQQRFCKSQFHSYS